VPHNAHRKNHSEKRGVDLAVRSEITAKRSRSRGKGRSSGFQTFPEGRRTAPLTNLRRPAPHCHHPKNASAPKWRFPEKRPARQLTTENHACLASDAVFMSSRRLAQRRQITERSEGPVPQPAVIGVATAALL
jgi:hypothetical protein